MVTKIIKTQNMLSKLLKKKLKLETINSNEDENRAKMTQKI